MRTDNISIRFAKARDAEIIARIHATSWRAAYKGIVPQDFLDGPLYETKLKHWSEIWTDWGQGDQILLIEVDGSPRGFVAAWTRTERGCEPPFDLYINNLHIDPDWRGHRLGDRLLSALALTMAGHAPVRTFLWVLDGNDPARRFYARLGGRMTDHQIKPIGGVDLGEARFVWDDFRTLADLELGD